MSLARFNMSHGTAKVSDSFILNYFKVKRATFEKVR
jgi:hypothetical protein